MESREKVRSTVSDSFQVDKAARSIFESWLPAKWLARKQDPDFHVDYRIEVVEQDEPTGLNFQAQIKGRSMYKRATSRLTEPLKTKHLRYYLRCDEPVFVFLIDPASRKGNWLFVQRYLKENASSKELRQKKTLTLQFNPQKSFENVASFQDELKSAWAYMRDMHPGSPLAAILAEKQRLEELDPRCSVQIVATAQSKMMRIQPRTPSCEGMKLKFLNRATESDFQSFYELGEAVQIKATDLQAEGSPIFADILSQIGDAKITIQSGATFRGHVLLLPDPSCGDGSQIQVDGEWLLAPKRMWFKGHLAESPLKVEFVWDPPVGEIARPVAVLFRFNLIHWQGQALQGLAYFKQLSELVTAKVYDLVCFIRGNHVFKAKYILPEGESRNQVMETFDWLKKCRRVAQKLGVNPVFPDLEVFHGKKCDHTHLLVKVLECGGHEQNNAGQELEMSCDAPLMDISHMEEPLTLQRTEPIQIMDFFGVQVPFGPLNHTWTDMHLISTKPLNANKIQLMFKGGPQSMWRIKKDEPPTVAAAKK